MNHSEKSHETEFRMIFRTILSMPRMKINIVGGGPAGLYFALLMKKLDRAHEISIFERDGPDDTFGWGIVFSDKTMSYLINNDRETAAAIMGSFEAWDNVDVVHMDQKISIRGNRFSGIGRLAFLNILQERCLDLGVDVRFRTNITEPDMDDLVQCDLFVGADGANSLVRRRYGEFFHPTVDVRKNKYIWLGTHHPFDGLALTFREHPSGVYVSHSYRFNPTTSTFIVECPADTWERAGFERMSDGETCEYLGRVFEKDLGGHPLLSNNFVRWLNFTIVKNRRWHHGNTVLLGDALHTAHFSIGSGTKLALEDSIALVKCFMPNRGVQSALQEFERVRKPIVDGLQQAAHASLIWFENVKDRLHLEPIPLAYEVMTRSGRVDEENLQKRDPEFVAHYEDWAREKILSENRE